MPIVLASVSDDPKMNRLVRLPHRRAAAVATSARSLATMFQASVTNARVDGRVTRLAHATA
jgi:hypothetical protein